MAVRVEQVDFLTPPEVARETLLPFVFSDQLPGESEMARVGPPINPTPMIPESVVRRWTEESRKLPDFRVITFSTPTDGVPASKLWIDTYSIPDDQRPQFRQYNLLELERPVVQALMNVDWLEPFTLSDLDAVSEAQLTLIHGIGKDAAREIKSHLHAFKQRVAAALGEMQISR